MPRKKKLTEPEIHALIVKEAKYRLAVRTSSPTSRCIAWKAATRRGIPTQTGMWRPSETRMRGCLTALKRSRRPSRERGASSI